MKAREFAGSYPIGSKGQAKGKDRMPKAKKGRKRHPLQGKLVGGSQSTIKTITRPNSAAIAAETPSEQIGDAFSIK